MSDKSPASGRADRLGRRFTLKVMSLLLVICLLPLLSYFVVSFRVTQKSILDMASERNAEVVHSQKEYLTLQMEQIEALAANLSQVEEISNSLAARNAQGSFSTFDVLATKARIGYLLSNYRNIPGLVSIDLFSLNGDHYHVGDTLPGTAARIELRDSLMARTFKSSNLVVWHGVQDNVQILSNTRKVVAATKLVMRANSSWLKAEPVGMILINYSTAVLHEHFSSVQLGEGAALVVVDDQGRLVFHPDRALIGSEISDELRALLVGDAGSALQEIGGEQVLLSHERLPAVNWQVVSLVPRRTLMAPMRDIKTAGGGAFVVSLLLIGILLRLYARSIVSPIAAISDGFKQFQNGTLATGWRLRQRGSLAQIGELTNWFNAFLDGMDRDREAETHLRIAATAFESQQGMFVTDAKGVILQVNAAFTAATGYSAEEAVGQTPRLLKSGRQTPAFYAALHQQLERTGLWKGEIWNRRKSGEIYPEWLTITGVRDSAAQITHFVATLTDITQRKKNEDEIRSLAFYDPLTALPNRRLLIDRLQRALLSCHRKGSQGALLFIDLDKFKNLNDTLGHDKGDLLLIEVGVRLTACLRDDDTVARLGGDEFVVLLEGLGACQADAAKEVESVCAKIHTALNQPYDLAGSDYHLTPSTGIVLFSDRQQTVDELMKQADIAMYQAKESGRNTSRFFDPQMQRTLLERSALEGGLREALVREEFVLHFQPQFDRQRRHKGAEVLLRWQPAGRAMVSPAEFIPLAEETGLILPIGTWVLRATCAQLQAWSHDPRFAHLTLSVNVSARQFREASFDQTVHEILAQTGADPRRLRLELTESLLLDNVDNIRAKMSRLQRLGVGFSIDDFGTGYSSLSYLKRLPLNELKIDQSFVRDVDRNADDASIARTVIALGKSMNLEIIAEGVETVAQHQFLLDNGCEAFQGYLFSRPLPLREFEAFASRPLPV